MCQGLKVVHNGPYSSSYQIPGLTMGNDRFSKSRIARTFLSDYSLDVRHSFNDVLAHVVQQMHLQAASGHKHVTLSSVQMMETATGEEPALTLVREWYPDDILQYVSKTTQGFKIGLLIQAARGIEYLHNHDVVHGHIHPGNIFVTQEGFVTAVDPGIYTEACRLFPGKGIKTEGNSFFHPAPELLHAGLGAAASPKKPSDVYAFGSLIYTVLTGNPTFGAGRSLTGNRLQLIKPIDDVMEHSTWDLVQQCCQSDPAARPTMSYIVSTLEDNKLYRKSK